MFLFVERFGLFEAMSAIEMMDPKMDAGMIGNQVNRKVLNFEQAIKVIVLGCLTTIKGRNVTSLHIAVGMTASPLT